jgi:dTDP-glucose pyrophosphorylase
MQAVILAAGRGKRLLPLTSQRSKAMLPILGKPMVSRIVEAIASNGVKNFIIVSSPGDNPLQTYFQLNPLPGIDIQIIEQPKPEGMAQALTCVKEAIHGDFLLSACDSLISPNAYAGLFASWTDQPQSAALLALMIVSPDKASQMALVQTENDHIIKIVEKPSPGQIFSNHASLPIYIFQPGILNLLSQVSPSPRGEYELQDAIQLLINDQKIVRGVLIHERQNLTSAQDLLEINLHFLQIEKPQFIHDTVSVGQKVVFVPPYWIGPQTIIQDLCVIGPNVYVESDCYIDQHCQISDALLLKGSKLNPSQNLRRQISC